jgi:hypothetical protein
MSASRLTYIGILCVILCACQPTPFPPYIRFEGFSSCGASHPIAAYLSCPNTGSDPLDIPPPVTRRNANDQYLNKCMLEWAADFGDLSVFKLLLANGADIHLCPKGYSERIYGILIARCERNQQHSIAPFFSLLESLRVLPPNAQTLLQSASKRGCADAIRFLANHGANLNYEYSDGLRPLHYLVPWPKERNIETVRVLVELGADPHLPSRSAPSPFEYAKQTLGKGPYSSWPKMESALTRQSGAAQPIIPPDAAR